MVEIKLPLILINFKCYSESIGEKAVKLAKICEKISQEKEISIIVSPQHADIFRISQSVKIPIFAQAIDPITPGKHTGHILPEDVKEAGASGSLINHSEHPVSLEEIEACIKRLRELELKSCVCVPDLNMTEKVVEMKPDFIAFEVPELVGTGKAISKFQPDSVKKFVEIVSKVEGTIPLCGAGISTGEDVKAALDLGTKGVLIASAFVKSEDPEKKLRELVGLI